MTTGLPRLESVGASGPGEALPLAEAKLAPPRPRPGLVERPRIDHALDAGGGAALTLVAAPAGYGKTTAVRAWSASRDAALAWVVLDAGENDPVRLWTYVATAVDGVRQGLGRGALRRLRVAGGPIEGPIDELADGIAVFGDELVLVLDDLQVVTDPECLASIEYLIKRLPANARLIVITRTDPALRLPYLRAGGDLAELRAGELAFTASEAREFFGKRSTVELEADEIELLRERTRGWPAALFLAALWLHGVDDPHGAVRQFGGDHRFIAEYLSNEVICALADDTRWFLLRAAVLGRFTAKLCDDVLRRTDSASILADLERANLFVGRSDHGGWYEVHSLFAEFARFRLASEQPGAVPAIHRRAARWLKARGLAVEAVEHAAAAGDHQFVGELLVEYHLPLIRTGAGRTLLRWLPSLPDEDIVARPELAVGGATAATMLGRAFQRRRLLHLADRAQSEYPERCTAYVRAVADMVRASAVDGDVGQAVVDGRRAVAVARADAEAVLVAALAGYARALYLAGDLDAAWENGMQAVELPDAPRQPPGHAFARSTLALVAADRGRSATARVHAEKAKELVGGVGSSRTWLGANASAALGAVLAVEGQLGDAERELAGAAHIFRDEVASIHHAWVLVNLARVRCRRGRLAEAAATLASAREALDELGDSGRVPSLADEVERELQRATGRADSGAMLDAPSAAELAVLRLLASDLSARQIGGELFLSPNTIRTHTRAIYRKLAVNSRADAVARADALGLLGEAKSPM